MKRNFGLIATIVAILLVFSFAAVGCGSDDDPVDGDTPTDGDNNPDGDQSTDGDQPVDGDSDGDQTVDGDADGDLVVDGDDEQEVVTYPMGSIAGTVKTSADLAAFSGELRLYNESPYETHGVEPISTQAVAFDTGSTEKEYSFTDLTDGQYYLMFVVDVDDDQEAANDFMAVHPDQVNIVRADSEQRDITGIDIYANVQNQDWGSVDGTLYLTAEYEDRPVTIVAAQQKPGGELEFWPSAIFLTAPATTRQQERSFSLMNLTDGTYFVVAFITLEDDQGWKVFVSPYRYEILASDSTKKTYTDQPFYPGQQHPELGSISGFLTLGGAIDGGLTGVYLFSDPAKPLESAVSWTFIEKNDTDTQYAYTVKNLHAQTGIYIAGFYQQQESWPYSLAIWPDEIEIDFNDPYKKDWTGVNFDLAITAVSGTLNLPSTGAPTGFSTVARLILYSIADNEYAAGTDLFLGNPEDGQWTADFLLYPVPNGDWTPILIPDMNGDNVIDGNDDWCYEPNDTITIDGTQASQILSSPIFFYWNKCVDSL